MRDPHIVRLHFTIGPEEGTAYRDPQPLAFMNVLGRFASEGKALIVEPVAHFAREEEARAAIEPSWEIESDLCFNVGTIRFSFDRAFLVDRDPPPPPPAGSHVLIAGTARMTMTGHSATLVVTRSSYPPPPTTFTATPEVQAAYQRWRNARIRQEPLLGMAYWLLTLMETMASGRGAATAVFNIDKKVLDTVGRLTSTKGDLDTSRKVVMRAQQPLSGPEQSWLEQTVKVLIRRLGERSIGSPTMNISMADLPPL
jgi:hypothetical protein